MQCYKQTQSDTQLRMAQSKPVGLVCRRGPPNFNSGRSAGAMIVRRVLFCDERPLPHTSVPILLIAIGEILVTYYHPPNHS